MEVKQRSLFPTLSEILFPDCHQNMPKSWVQHTTLNVIQMMFVGTQALDLIEYAHEVLPSSLIWKWCFTVNFLKDLFILQSQESTKLWYFGFLFPLLHYSSQHAHESSSWHIYNCFNHVKLFVMEEAVYYRQYNGLYGTTRWIRA